MKKVMMVVLVMDFDGMMVDWVVALVEEMVV